VTPSLLGPVASIAEADRLLDGLDQLARMPHGENEFWRQFLIVLQSLSQARTVTVLTPVQSEWVTVATLGELPSSYLQELDKAKQHRSPHGVYEGRDSQGTWIASIIEPSKSESGVLLITYGPDAPATLIESGRLLLDPFCEILQTRFETTRPDLDRHWCSRLEECIRSLSKADSPAQLQQVLVDQAVLALEGARVSMVVRGHGGQPSFQLLSSSGASQIDRTSSTVKRLEHLAELSYRKSGTTSWSNRSTNRNADSAVPTQETVPPNRDSFGVFEHGIALVWERFSDGAPHSWLLIEWPDAAAMEKAIPRLASWCNTIYGVWLPQNRWTRVPARMRERSSQQPTPWLAKTRKYASKLLGIAVAIGLLWGLILPYPMTIESNAVLEPVERRLIHASADGYIMELLVDDGDRVMAQQELARLRSPSLELQVEEALGRLRAIAEKRNGLKVAINQLSPSAPDTLANQTRLSTELLMLDTNESQAREMLSFYQAEQSRLILRSPIDGVIVAKQLRQELENRPIRRGDPLLQVVDLSGDWQLRIQVADRDSDFVGRYYGTRETGRLEKQVHYTFDSLPSQEFAAEVTAIARVIENRDGTGGFQEVLAKVAATDASRAHMGATARVRFACGREPFGYVWSRPLIEFLQKRFRLFSWPQTSVAPP
jgi:multidrug efflux pump subunit AcrA (membrane-fusion protein)